MASAIPKVVHMIWIQGEAHLVETKPWWSGPDGRKASWARWMPQWQVKVWSGAEVEQLLRTHYPQLLRVYHAPGIKFACQSDIGRYAIIHRFGGLYADVTYQVVRSFDWFFEGDVDVVAMYHDVTRAEGRMFGIFSNNCWFAAVARHRSMARLIDHMAALQIPRTWSAKTILTLTGPNALWNALQHELHNPRARFIPSTVIDPTHMAHGMPEALARPGCTMTTEMEKTLQQALPGAVAIHNGNLSYANPVERMGVKTYGFVRRHGVFLVPSMFLVILALLVAVCVLAVLLARVRQQHRRAAQSVQKE